LSVRVLSLARIAAEAEGLRLRHSARRTAIRGVLGLIALAWVLGAVVFVHIAIWNWLEASVGWTPLATAWTLAGIDAVIALVLGLVAAFLGPGKVEVEALAVRARAVDGATRSLGTSALLIDAARVGTDLLRRRRN
jgi:hypothetical protein